MAKEYKYNLGDIVIITKGRLKGERGTVIGETNLNMDYRIIVSRHNKRARDKTMGFYRDELRKVGHDTHYDKFAKTPPAAKQS